MTESSSSSTEVHWVTQRSLPKSTRVNTGTRARYKPHTSQQNQDKSQAEMHRLSWQEGWLSLGLSEKMPSARSLLCWVTVVSCTISTTIHLHLQLSRFSVRVANLDSAYGCSRREVSYKKVAKMQEKPCHCCFSETHDSIPWFTSHSTTLISSGKYLPHNGLKSISWI